MKRCSQCGKEVADDLAVFCPNCGSTFAPSGVGVPTQPSSAPSYLPPTTPPEEKIPFFQKLLRAAMLDSSLYEAVEHDPTALRHAAYAIILVNILTGLGFGIYDALTGGPVSAFGTVGFTLVVALQILFALAKWLLLTGVVYLIGVLLFKGTAGFEEVARTIAFAYAPVALQILIALTYFSELISLSIVLLTNLWFIVALVIAVRQSLDMSTGKALVVVVIAGIIYTLALVLFQL